MITCAGLYSDRIAYLTGGKRDPFIVPFRGEWRLLKPEYNHLINTLVYPVENFLFIKQNFFL